VARDDDGHLEALPPALAAGRLGRHRTEGAFGATSTSAAEGRKGRSGSWPEARDGLRRPGLRPRLVPGDSHLGSAAKGCPQNRRSVSGIRRLGDRGHSRFGPQGSFLPSTGDDGAIDNALAS